MFKKFCPMVHAICEDGYPAFCDVPCCLWDSVNEVCVQVQQMLASDKLSQRAIEKLGSDQDSKYMPE